MPFWKWFTFRSNQLPWILELVADWSPITGVILSLIRNDLYVFFLKSAMTKVQEGAAKLSESEQQVVLGRADVVTYTVLAEIDHFNQRRVVDFKGYLRTYVGGQIEFYKQVRTDLMVSGLLLHVHSNFLIWQYMIHRSIRCYKVVF